MIYVFAAIFGSALLAPVLYRLFRSRTGWVLAVVPAGAFAYLLSFAEPVLVRGETVFIRYGWFPSLDVHMTFYLDGLSLLFGFLITGIGTLIVIYGGGYLKGDRDVPRFYLSLLLFMGSMLGVVLSSNLIALFIFWEGTSFTSYLLIGYRHEDETARRNALQALLVTGVGGLAMFAGFLLLQLAGGSWELMELLTMGPEIREHAAYVPILLLILAGAATKSAQFPFHFWLPNAMVAPTPVSAYLHSATMVKAGVYLLARLLPILGGTALWTGTVTTVGAVTMVVTAWLALCYSDLKQILAYSTLLILGMLVMLIGMGTPAAIRGAVVMIFAHALYKGALFMIAGCVDHGTGTRDVTELGGLFESMPVSGTLACLAALSMAGLPPAIGFIGKESIFEATLHFMGGSTEAMLLTGATAFAGVCVLAAAGLVSVHPFFGREERSPQHPHEASVSMLLGPGLLALGGLAFGLWPASVDHSLLAGAASSILGAEQSFHLALFHGVNEPLLISGGIAAVGIVVYLFWPVVWNGEVFANVRGLFGEAPDRTYDVAVKGLKGTAYYQTRVLQSGVLRYYLMFVFITFVVLAGLALIGKAPLSFEFPSFGNVYYYEWIVVVFMVSGAFAAVWARTKLAAIISLGITGFSVAMLYMLFSAPDLVITQILVETLTVILIALVMVYLPVTPEEPELNTGNVRDVLIAGGAGLCVTSLAILALSSGSFDAGLIREFADKSYVDAHGRNIVNVILVDFRALDTLGEITVLGTAAIGVYALIHMSPADASGEEREEETSS